MRSNPFRSPQALTAFARFVGLIFSVALVLLALPTAAFAQQADGGAARNGSKDAGANGAATSTATDVGGATGDGGAAGSPDGGNGLGSTSGSPLDTGAANVHLPQTEAEKSEGQPIAAIDVSGNRRVAKDDVVSYLKLKPGQLFKVDALTTDVRALWDAGFFDDIEVDLTRGDKGVTIRFLVRERPNIKELAFEGNEEIEADKLTEAIEVKPNTILSVPAVRRSVQKIKDSYAEKGYFLADVESAIEPQRDNEVVVKFKITEHSPVSVRRITFVGNYNVPEEELRVVMQTGQGGFL
ncbi:MAG: POTRA domain-containing protein, partial [Polyangiaceae bacterium]